MAIVLEIPYTKKLEQAKSVLGSDSDLDTIEMGLDKILESENISRLDENVETNGGSSALDDAYWEDLFSDPPIPTSAVIAAFNKEREDRF
ncbi:MAG: hypothetical protein ACRD6X_02620 [Pyrinomonadaceae bacterium]